MQKNAIIVIVVLLTLFAVALGWQQNENKKSVAKAETLIAKIAAQESDLKSLRDEIAEVREQKKALIAESDALRSKLDAMRSAGVSTPAVAQESPKDLGSKIKNAFSLVLDDPQVKERMRKHHLEALRAGSAKLIKELGLTPEEGERLIALMADSQSRNFEAMWLGKGKPSSDPALATATALKESGARAQTTAEIKSLLGDARYKQYEDYQRTAAERGQIEQFSNQLSSTAAPLQEFQSKQLLTIIGEEKARLGMGSPDEQLMKSLAGGGNALSEESMNKQIATQEQINQQVLARAQSILTSDQFSAFSTFQNSEFERQKKGMQFMGKWLGGTVDAGE